MVNEKLSNTQQMEERSVWARDSYDIHRPLNQRLARPRPEKIWQKNEVGNKRAFETMEVAAREAAAGSYQLYRPLAGGGAPWEVHSRAEYVTATCMPQSLRQ